MSDENILRVQAPSTIQRKTSKFLKREDEADLLINADVSQPGLLKKVKGYAQKGTDIAGADFDTTTTTSSSSTSTSSSTSSSTSTSTSSSSTTTMA